MNLQSAYPETSSMNIRQALLLGTTVCLSRYSTFLPRAAAQSGAGAALLLPLFTLFPLLVLLILHRFLIGNRGDMRLDKTFRERLPGGMYRLIMALYAIGGIGYSALYLRLYSAKLSVMIFYQFNPTVFMIALLCVAALILTAPPVVLARINGLIALFIPAVLWLLIFCLIPETHFSVLWPPHSEQVHTMIPYGLLYGGVWMYYLPAFLCGDRVVPVGNIRKTTIAITAGAALTVVALTLVVLAQLGPELASRVYLPLLYTLRSSSQSVLARSEVLLISLWILGDAVFITLMSRMALFTSAQALGIPQRPILILPLLAAVFVVSYFLSGNSDAVQETAQNLLIPLNLVFGLVIPAWVMLFGRLYRKVLASRQKATRENERITQGSRSHLSRRSRRTRLRKAGIG